MTVTRVLDDDAQIRAELRERLGSDGLKIAQPDEPPLFTRTPESPMQPMHWKWADLHAYLEELGRVLDLKAGGDRRTLRLANPGLEYGTTPTFWASIQYINPGEVATAHRHSPDAFRFVMHGNGCSTTVEGEQYEMNEGDLVLTPNWMFHDHVHNGDEPMIWLDVLNISLSRKLENIFFDPYEAGVQPVSNQPQKSWREFGSGLMRPAGPAPKLERNPLLVYTKAQADAALTLARGLEPDPVDDVILEYQNPAGGGPALPSLSMKSQIIRPGFHGLMHRHSGSKAYYALKGSGTMLVNDQRFDWGKGDFITVPPYAKVQHINNGTEEGGLFRVDDTPIFRYLNAYFEETIPADGQTA
ncbi:cupin domain-containing protein [Pseudarthrobacter sulfonivorans]|uniref:cupin domain-containing protein n=1 Tax=Pseudarthrobacter sulfonivorans TaxID=121292 RepID=UPI0027886F1F|nr:cupin domain-containing protein [Pseudarthrobacter sulfonivorans]MDP9998433.1 gentisate 1,2-dioxygenase [Pseudarthrobacter sulfonivorans]